MTLRYISPFYIFLLLVFAGIQSLQAQYIQVDTQTYTPEELVKNIFFGQSNNNCISVDNVSINGKDFGNGNRSYGYFTKGNSNFEMDGGIILSTGSALTAVGPNDYIQTQYEDSEFADPTWGGDSDLIQLLTDSGLNTNHILNATTLEFDFTSFKAENISFNYMFLSEEYQKDNEDYSDAFAFLIRKVGTTTPYKNIALVPGTDTPVTSLTINERIHSDYFGGFNDEESTTNFNGQTKILTASTTVDIGQKYHIKLVIADHGDPVGLYDSAVFLEAGSFSGNIDLGKDNLNSLGTGICEGSSLDLDVTVPNANTSTTYSWYKNDSNIPVSNSPQYSIREEGTYRVIIDEAGCISKGSIRVEFSEKPVIGNTEFCNYNNGNSVSINLQDFTSSIISNYKPYFSIEYKDANGNPIADKFTYSSDSYVYIHIKSGNCAAVTQKIMFKIPKVSETLKDENICPANKATLDAGPGFSYYAWYNVDDLSHSLLEGVDARKFDAPIGNYTVKLTSSNNCSYDQEVKVSAAEAPVINNIEVNGSTATVHVSGGTRPYYYSLDDPNNWTSNSNIFTNITRGTHIMYVKDAAGCTMLEKPFIIINLINAITPNGDGINDVLDYSDLKIKENVSLQIFDRHGREVYRSHPNEFVWDGTSKGHAVPTGTYWYLLKWTEPDTGLPVSYSDWILVKNRN